MTLELNRVVAALRDLERHPNYVRGMDWLIADLAAPREPTDASEERGARMDVTERDDRFAAE